MTHRGSGLVERRMLYNGGFYFPPGHYVSYQLNELSLQGGERIDLLDDGRVRSEQPALLAVGSKGRGLYKVDPRQGIYEKVKLDTNLEGKIRRAFIRISGDIVLQTTEPNRVYTLNAMGQILSLDEGPKYLWHGAMGIDENSQGTLLFAEYRAGQDDVDRQPIRVWKYDGPAAGWRAVLEVAASRKPQLADIRHFHACFSDPYSNGRWYLSSGDRESQIRFWLSEDDGESWRELVLLQEDNGWSVDRRKFRFTAGTVVSKGRIRWVTDDAPVEGYAAVCEGRIEHDTVIGQVLGRLGRNFARNMVQVDGDLALVVTESKSNLNSCEVFFVRSDGLCVHAIELPNVLGNKSGVTASMGSRVMAAGSAYFPRFTGILQERWQGFVEFNVERERGIRGRTNRG